MGKYLDKASIDELQSKFGSLTYSPEEKEPQLYVEPGELLALMQELQAGPAWAFDRMANITAVDYREYIEMVYMLYSRRFDLWVTVKCRLDRQEPVVESMTQVWPGTEFEEREIFDLMGVRFLHHPDMRRILMPEDYPAHPLRKDFQPPQPYIEGGVLKWQQPKNLS